MANSTSLPYEQVDWNKEVQDQDDVLRASDTESGDFAQSDGTKWIPKSVSEMKTLLGLPSKVYKAFVNCSSTSNPTITVIKNTLESDVTWTRDEPGYYTIAVKVAGVPSGEFTSGKTIALAQPKSSNSVFMVSASVGTNSINFLTGAEDGTLTDSLDFYVSIEVYE